MNYRKYVFQWPETKTFKWISKSDQNLYVLPRSYDLICKHSLNEQSCPTGVNHAIQTSTSAIQTLQYRRTLTLSGSHLI